MTSRMPDPSDPLLAGYMNGATVLIVDMSASSRPVIRRLMSALGAKPSNVLVAESFEEARLRIETAKPTVVFADYALGKQTAIDLLDAFMKACPDRLRSMFVVMSGDNSPAAATAIAEADVDALMVRPFNAKELQDRFIEALAPKLNPSLSLRLIEAGRRVLLAGHPQQAIKAFVEAGTKDPASAKACAMEGAARRAAGDLEGALRAYQAGVSRDPYHYHSLAGLFETQLEAKRYAQAYETAMTLCTHYPLSPQRVPNVIRLCIILEKFGDVLRFHEALSRSENVDPTVLRYVSAGLVVCGKHLLGLRRHAEALEVLRKAELASRSRPQVIREILVALYAAGLADAADELRRRSAPEVAESEEVQLAILEWMNSQGNDAKVALFGQAMIDRGVAHPRVFEITIAQSMAIGRSRNAIEELVWKAVAAFPDRREHFERLLSAAA